jgi:hypothetical protein
MPFMICVQFINIFVLCFSRKRQQAKDFQRNEETRNESRGEGEISKIFSFVNICLSYTIQQMLE